MDDSLPSLLQVTTLPTLSSCGSGRLLKASLTNRGCDYSSLLLAPRAYHLKDSRPYVAATDPRGSLWTTSMTSMPSQGMYQLLPSVWVTADRISENLCMYVCHAQECGIGCGYFWLIFYLQTDLPLALYNIETAY